MDIKGVSLSLPKMRQLDLIPALRKDFSQNDDVSTQLYIGIGTTTFEEYRFFDVIVILRKK